MRKIALIVLALCYSMCAFAVVDPALVPDVFVQNISTPIGGVQYNTGSDYRIGPPCYDKYHYVTTTDYVSSFTSQPFTYWETYIGTSGRLGLPAGARDPDVIFLNDPAFTTSFILCVFYNTQTVIGPVGYYYRLAQFNCVTNEYLHVGTDVPIELSTPAAPCINVDADDKGNFCIVWTSTDVMGNQRIKTQRGSTNLLGPYWTSGITEMTSFSNGIEPDVAVTSNAAGNWYNFVCVYGTGRASLRKSNASNVWSFSLAYTYTPVGPPSQFFNPRIACPPFGSEKTYSIVVLNRHVGPPLESNIELLYSKTSTMGIPIPRILNNNSIDPLLPAINLEQNNLPCVSYSTSPSGTSADYSIGVLWYAHAPSQSIINQIIGLEFTTLGSLALATNYMAASQLHAPGIRIEAQPSSIAGRFADKKACSFLSNHLTSASFQYYWKRQSWGASTWRTSNQNNQANSLDEKPIEIYPNPTSNDFSIQGNEQNNHQVEINDLRGKLIFKLSGKLSDINHQLASMPDFTTGIYLVNIKDLITKEIKIEKLVKQ